jgi:hypothetical protein
VDIWGQSAQEESGFSRHEVVFALIYLINQFYTCCNFKVICEDNIAINFVTVQHKNGSLPSNLTGNTPVTMIILARGQFVTGTQWAYLSTPASTWRPDNKGTSQIASTRDLICNKWASRRMPALRNVMEALSLPRYATRCERCGRSHGYISLLGLPTFSYFYSNRPASRMLHERLDSVFPVLNKPRDNITWGNMVVIPAYNGIAKGLNISHLEWSPFNIPRAFLIADKTSHCTYSIYLCLTPRTRNSSYKSERFCRLGVTRRKTEHLNFVHRLYYKIIKLQLIESWILLPSSGKKKDKYMSEAV